MNEEMEPRRLWLLMAELANTFFWIHLDAAWLFESPVAAMLISVPTILTCALIWYFSERDFAGTLVAAVITGWVLINFFWIMGDFDLVPYGDVIAKILVAPTLVVLYAVIAVLFRRHGLAARLAGGLRRVRLF